MENTQKLVAMIGHRHKKQAVRELSDGIPRKLAANLLGVKAKTIKYAKSNSNSADTLQDANYAVGITYSVRTTHEISVMTSMFIHTTTVLSGAEKHNLRNLEMSRTVWQKELHALYPTFLREFVYFHPEVYREAERCLRENEHVTKFQYKILAAEMQAGASDWDGEKELHERRAEVIYTDCT